MPWPLPFPFELAFMQRALVAGVVVGVFAPMIGTFVVQKRMSLIGDGIGHIAFAGVGAGMILAVSPDDLGMWPVGGALVFAIVGALGIEWLRSRRAASGDLALALFFYSGIAGGVVLAGLGDGLNRVFVYLFGQPLTVDAGEIVVIVVLGAAIVVAMLALGRAMFAVVTDEEWSRVAGLPVGVLNSVLAISIAVSVVAAMRVVGILLIAAMMVLPVASGQLLARSFRGTMWWSVAIGVGSVVLGLALARVWGLVPSGTIVLIAAACFAVVAVAKRGVALRLRTGGSEA